MTSADETAACWAAGRAAYGRDTAERTSAAPALRAGSARGPTATVALVSFAMLVVSLDQYIVIVALPDIGDGLGIDGQRLQAVISVNLIAAAGATILGAGGVLTHAFGWRSVFASNLALAAVALAFARRTVPVDPRPTSRSTPDVAAAITITFGLSSLSYGLIQGPIDGWATASIIATLAAGTAMLGAFAHVERRSRYPLLPRRLRGAQRRLTLALGLLFAGSFGAVLYVLSIHLQQVRHYGELAVGVVFLIPTGAVIAGSALGGRMVSACGPRRALLVVLPVGAAGAIGLGFAAHAQAPLIALVPGLIAVSVADGVTFTALFIAMTQGLSDGDQGIGAGLISTATAIGGALGLAVVVPIIHGPGATTSPAPGGVGNALNAIALGIAVMVVMVVLTSRMPWPEARPDP